MRGGLPSIPALRSAMSPFRGFGEPVLLPVRTFVVVPPWDLRDLKREDLEFDLQWEVARLREASGPP